MCKAVLEAESRESKLVCLVYLPAFVLRPSAKPHQLSRKMIVATMASVITSATAFVSTISTASVSRPRPRPPEMPEKVSIY